MTTIVCSDCKRILGKEKFSKSQLKKKVPKARRCLSCAKIVDGCSNSNSNSHNNPCYHGCITKEEFDCVEHHKVLEGWDDGGKKNINEFYNKHKSYIRDPTFGNFVIAHVTDDYLKDKNNDILLQRLLLLLQCRYFFIPRHEGKDVDSPESETTKKFDKYSRDITTERGRINCMAREIPCDCMEEKRIEAKSMEKTARCFGCHNEVPKENMLRCKCNHVQYCSKECSKNHWPKHKKSCTKYNVSSATTSTSASVPSSFEKLSDVDAEEE